MAAAATNSVDQKAAPARTVELGIGSLISVTSISENRYEGFLIDMNFHSIGLRDVKFFGTEGRLKDGPQISAHDTIYEYIYLRGSNIKDLQVVFSPSPQSTSVVPVDPGIIGPRFPHPTPTTLASTSHGAANVSTSARPVLPVTSFQLNQPGDSSASSSSFWSSFLPPPPANISRLAEPNYWPGLDGSSEGISYFQHQFAPPPQSLVASEYPVQQQANHQNVNTSVVGGSSFFEHQHPLLLLCSTGPKMASYLPEEGDVIATPAPFTDERNSVELTGASPMTIEEQSGPTQSSPSQSLQTTNVDAKTAPAPVMEPLPSDSSEENLESLLESTTKTGSTSSHHDKGTQFAQGRYQNPRVIRRFTEDFDFDAMNEKFNKKEVWELFSKNNKGRADDGGEATEVHDNSKPIYRKDDFFDYLSYCAPELETLIEHRRRDDETFGIEIPILHHGKGLHSFGGRGHGNVRGGHRGPGRKVWRPVLK